MYWVCILFGWSFLSMTHAQIVINSASVVLTPIPTTNPILTTTPIPTLISTATPTTFHSKVNSIASTSTLIVTATPTLGYTKEECELGHVIGSRRSHRHRSHRSDSLFDDLDTDFLSPRPRSRSRHFKRLVRHPLVKRVPRSLYHHELLDHDDATVRNLLSRKRSLRRRRRASVLGSSLLNRPNLALQRSFDPLDTGAHAEDGIDEEELDDFTEKHHHGIKDIPKGIHKHLLDDPLQDFRKESSHSSLEDIQVSPRHFKTDKSSTIDKEDVDEKELDSLLKSDF